MKNVLIKLKNIIDLSLRNGFVMLMRFLLNWDKGDLTTKKRYSEEKIIGAIKENEAGARVGDLCRQLYILSCTLCNWRSKHVSMEVNGAK